MVKLFIIFFCLVVFIGNFYLNMDTVMKARRAQQFINCVYNNENTHMSLGECSSKYHE